MDSDIGDLLEYLYEYLITNDDKVYEIFDIMEMPERYIHIIEEWVDNKYKGQTKES